MSGIDHMLEANAVYADTFTAAAAPARPSQRLAIVVCMDARIDPAAAFGLAPGDAHVIRNAGGRMADAIRSLAISQQFLDTEEVAIVHHSGCGMESVTDDEVRAALRENLGADARAMDFLPFQDLEESVREDIQLYRSSPLLRQDIAVRGFVYEVETGRLREVTVARG